MKKKFKSIIALGAALTVALSSLCIVGAVGGSAQLSPSNDQAFVNEQNEQEQSVPMYFTYTKKLEGEVTIDWGDMDFTYSPGKTEPWDDTFTGSSLVGSYSLNNNEIKVTNGSNVDIEVYYNLFLDETYTDLESVGFRCTTENKNGVISPSGDSNVELNGGNPQTIPAMVGTTTSSDSAYVTVENVNPSITGTYNKTKIGDITVSVVRAARL